MSAHLKWFIQAVCVLNTGHQDAQIRLTYYFEDRDPMDQFTAVRIDKIKCTN